MARYILPHGSPRRIVLSGVDERHFALGTSSSQWRFHSARQKEYISPGYDIT